MTAPDVRVLRPACAVPGGDPAACLARAPALKELGAAALQIIAVGAAQRRLVTGETLVRAGDTADAGYVVIKGALRLEGRVAGAAPALLGPGALIGELALITETVWRASVTAAAETTVLRISRNLFRKVLEVSPLAALALRERLAARAQSVGEDLDALCARHGRPAP